MQPNSQDPAGGPSRAVVWAVGIVGVIALIGIAVLASSFDARRGAGQELEAIAPRTTTTMFRVPTMRSSVGNVAQSHASTCKEVTQNTLVRSCRIMAPPDLKASERVPVVMLLHGFNMAPDEVAAQGGWAAAVSERRFVLVLPRGVDGAWNAGGCCGRPQTENIDDVGYLRDVLAQATEIPGADPTRLFVVGLSNGGMMADAFACAHSDVVAGVASVAGTPMSICQPVGSVPAIHVHGKSDDTVPYAGGESNLSRVLGIRFPSVPVAFNGLAVSMGCQSRETAPDSPDVVSVEDWPCAGSARARLVSIQGMTHGWPSGGTYDATTEILRFFAIE